MSTIFSVENLDIDAVPREYKVKLQKEIEELKKQKRKFLFNLS